MLRKTCITKTWPRLILAVILMGGASPQIANLVPSSTVTSMCTITQATALAFGAYDPLLTNRISALNVAPNAISVACTRGAPGVFITLDLGTHFVGSSRYMSDGATHTLQYEVYTSAARTTIWNATNSVAFTSTSMATTTLPVYAQGRFAHRRVAARSRPGGVPRRAMVECRYRG